MNRLNANMKPTREATALRPIAARRGAALLVTMFVVAMTSLLVVTMLMGVTSQYAAVRNAADYDRALYLAGAGVHHALAMLEADPAWRGTVSEADGSYSATAADDAHGAIVITGRGSAGAATRRLQVTVLND